MSIAYYQASLQYSADVQGTLDKYLRIPSPVIQFLTAEHFMMNDYMLELVTPVADLIGYLEMAETNLANIVVQFLITGFYPSPKSFWSCTHVNSCQYYTLYINLHILLNIL